MSREVEHSVRIPASLITHMGRAKWNKLEGEIKDVFKRNQVPYRVRRDWAQDEIVIEPIEAAA